MIYFINFIRVARDERHAAHMENMRRAYEILGKKPEIENRFGRRSCGRDDNITIGLEEICCKGCEQMELNKLAQDAGTAYWPL